MLIKFPCQSTHLVLRTPILLPDFQQQDSGAPVGSRNHESAYVAGEFIILAIRFYLASLLHMKLITLSFQVNPTFQLLSLRWLGHQFSYIWVITMLEHPMNRIKFTFLDMVF